MSRSGGNDDPLFPSEPREITIVDVRTGGGGGCPGAATTALRTSVAIVIVLACTAGVSSCGRWQCNSSFAASITGTVSGSPTPAAAIRDWARSYNSHPGHAAPRRGWKQTDASSSSMRHFTHGGWKLEVTAVPAGGWTVTAGTTC